MKFCRKCSSILVPAGNELFCKHCGHKEKADEAKLKETIKENKIPIAAVSTEIETLPTIKETCPKCENKEAFFWTQQTRASDEPETQFFRCKKCNHGWRKYL